MKYIFFLAMFAACFGSTSALTPRLDTSPGFYAGEWAGIGEHGAYCYLSLNADGNGWVLVDGGSGDWLVAHMKWRNQQQGLVVEKIDALPASSQQRTMPLDSFAVRSGSNQSLSLTWNANSSACQLQKTETLEYHRKQARLVVDSLPKAKYPE